MSATWNELAGSDRWRGVVSFIRNWVGPFDAGQGMTPEELDGILRTKSLHLPAAVREWWILAAQWKHGGLCVWLRPDEIAVRDGIVWILTDNAGVTDWGVRVADLDIEDPPVVSAGHDDPVTPAFSEFVAAMVVNDVLFDQRCEEPPELNPEAVRADSMCRFASCFGDCYADGPLESATVVMFAYPRGGAVLGKSRTTEGQAWLEQFRRTPT